MIFIVTSQRCCFITCNLTNFSSFQSFRRDLTEPIENIVVDRRILDLSKNTKELARWLLYNLYIDIMHFCVCGIVYLFSKFSARGISRTCKRLIKYLFIYSWQFIYFVIWNVTRVLGCFSWANKIDSTNDSTDSSII